MNQTATIAIPHPIYLKSLLDELNCPDLQAAVSRARVSIENMLNARMGKTCSNSSHRELFEIPAFAQNEDDSFYILLCDPLSIDVMWDCRKKVYTFSMATKSNRLGVWSGHRENVCWSYGNNKERPYKRLHIAQSSLEALFCEQNLLRAV